MYESITFIKMFMALSLLFLQLILAIGQLTSHSDTESCVLSVKCSESFKNNENVPRNFYCDSRFFIDFIVSVRSLTTGEGPAITMKLIMFSLEELWILNVTIMLFYDYSLIIHFL